MPRDFKGRGFSAASSYVVHEDADPRVGLVNLADVMLVFACGLMLALVVKWNIDLPNVKQLEKSDMQEVDNVDQIAGEITSSSKPYMELGKVYQDPTTGKLYMLTDEQGSGDSPQADAVDNAPAAARRAPVQPSPGEAAGGASQNGLDSPSGASSPQAGQQP